MSRGVGRQHGASRRALADAACEVIAAEGIQALTMRRVAGVAETSLGRVQHYFADRAALLLEAFNVTQQDAAAEVEASLHGSASGVDVVRAVLREMIPTNSTQQRQLRIMLQFEALALSDVTFAAHLREGHRQLRILLERSLAMALEVPEQTVGADAHRLLALAEGLGSEVLLGHATPDHALGLLETAVDDIIGRNSQ